MGDRYVLARLDLTSGRIVADRLFPPEVDRLPIVPTVSPDFSRIAWQDRRPRRNVVTLSAWGGDGADNVFLGDAIWERCGALVFSPDMHRLAALIVRASGIDVTLQMAAWDLRIKPRPNTFPDAPACIPCVENGPEDEYIDGIPMRAFTFSPDGRCLFGLRADHEPSVVRWDAETLDHHTGQWSLPGKGSPMVGHLAFALEGRQLAVAYDQKLAVIDCATGNVVSHREAPTVSRGLAAQPAGRIFATVDGTPTMRMWDITSGKQQAAVDVGIGPVTAVAFAPDGTTAAAGAAEGRIAQWDVAT